MKDVQVQWTADMKDEFGGLFVDGATAAEFKDGEQVLREMLVLARQGARVSLKKHDGDECVLIQQTGYSPLECEVTLGHEASMREAMEEGNLISAIKTLRSCVPMSLLAAKRIVEALRDGTKRKYWQQPADRM
jgi:hypothetical protein